MRPVGKENAGLIKASLGRQNTNNGGIFFSLISRELLGSDMGQILEMKWNNKTCYVYVCVCVVIKKIINNLQKYGLFFLQQHLLECFIPLILQQTITILLVINFTTKLAPVLAYVIAAINTRSLISLPYVFLSLSRSLEV